MAKQTKIVPQNYPRIQDESSPYNGCLNDKHLVSHSGKISLAQLKSFILSAIKDANKKSSRAILSISEDATPEEISKICKTEGKKLFAYFRKYCGDPASTAYQIHGKTYKDVGKEQFRNRTLQKERMNSGWRYQFLAFGCAKNSGRFSSVSDIGAAEGDFNAVIEFIKKRHESLSLYVSVKNRVNTMGGQDWPKAIQALENYAKNDKNRRGPYCCIFGIAMDRGYRHIKREQRTGKPHSVNTEIWLSDYFWPFFSNYSYENIMTTVLDVLMDSYSPDDLASQIEIPDELLEAFGQECKKSELIDAHGKFHDSYKLVKFFCGSDN